MPVNVDDRSGRAMLLRVAFDQIEDVLGILIGDEAAGDLEVGFARSHSLRAIAHEPAPNAVEIDGRARALTLQRGVAGLAPKGVRSGLAEEIIVRNAARRELVPLFLGEWSDLVVKAFNGNSAFRRVERRGELGQRLHRVWDKRAKSARMEIGAAGVEVDLAAGDSFEGNRE